MGCSSMPEVRRDCIEDFQSEKYLESIDNKDNSNSNCRRKMSNNNHSNKKGLFQRHNESSRINRNLEPYLQSKNDPFFNFPEVKKNICVGKGIKKMKGYISHITKEELIKKRNDFWGTRIEGNKEIWEFLKRICEDPELENEDLTPYLDALEIVPYNKCINLTYDSSGFLYEIPNYCIHDPTVYDLPENHIKKVQKKQIKFTVRKEMTNISVELSNYSTVFELKNIVKDNFPNCNNYNIEKIRLFFGGKELKNDQQLFIYHIEENSIILLLIPM